MATTSSNDNKNSLDYIVFFDLDRTLTGKISGRELVKTAFKSGLMSNSDLLYAFYLSVAYKFRLKDPVSIIDAMAAWVKDLPENRLALLYSKVFHEDLLPSLYPDAEKEIAKHKERKAKTVILSSSLKQLCMEMANYLGMDDVICSELEIINGIYTGLSLGAYCFGEEKAVRLKKYCEKNNSTADKAWYYGDSISDLPVLSSVGYPVCVNPDNKLKKAARQNKWPVVNWQ